MISKACVVGMYQRKLEELARFPGMELHVVVPPYWREGRSVLRLERTYISGYQLHVVPMALNGHFHVHFYPALAAVIRQLQPDIVHVDEEPYNLATFQATYLARRTGAKVLFFAWQNLPRHYPFPFSFFERYSLAHAACAIAGNQEAVQVLRSKGFARPIALLPQFGVDPELYRKRERSSSRRVGLVIGYVGRLVQEKGVQVLLEAVAGLKDDWTLRVVGDGPYAGTLRTLSTKLGLEGRVSFEPRISSSEVPQCLNDLDVLVVPSLTRKNWKEQFGRVLIEAMACEVPVVGSSSGEIPNLIGNAGLVFPEGDASALRDMLGRLATDAGLRADLGRRGHELVLEQYTQERIAADTHAIYVWLQAQAA